MHATAKDLRFHSTELLNTVKRGEEVIITYRGKPCAKLVPIEENKETSIITNELFGIWKDNERTENVENHVRNIRKGRFNAI
ncbi:MAG: type II toxin-antitoxin system prevent-host-death family antitoxin [Thermodesulfobacteriota bacterium]|nr:type II toxin-antitoxin system prevent-host-death family antitoxin [Thermodesulfobacteriota bacterium]